MAIKIMWLCNTLIPDTAIKLGITGSKPESWLTGLYAKLKDRTDAELTYLFPNETKKKIWIGKDLFTSFIQHSQTKFEEKQIGEFSTIIAENRPDVIHIMGTEYPHTYAMMKACESMGILDKTVISIQGLVSFYGLHMYASLSPKEVAGYTFRDLVRHESIYDIAQKFVKRGEYEQKALRLAKHVIGRTDWDYSCTHLINPVVQYHFCSETLRPSFYMHRWSIDSCERHSIFVSQSSSPIKGFHYMLEAMPYILKFYPDTHVYVTGKSPLATDINSKLRQTNYNRILGRLINKNHLENCVTFLGVLDEDQMRERYLNSHVFVSCSTIENSSNSIGEARMLGMPVIASYVGGTRFVTQGEDGLIYQADAPYMLASRVCEMFDDDEQAIKMGNLARERALLEHDPEKNLQALLNIYQEVSRS